VSQQQAKAIEQIKKSWMEKPENSERKPHKTFFPFLHTEAEPEPLPNQKQDK
jgi:hypothetical protein